MAVGQPTLLERDVFIDWECYRGDEEMLLETLSPVRITLAFLWFHV